MKKNMKPCKVCGQMIAKSAKRCPHCGAKQKSFLKKLLIILIALFVLFIMYAILSDSNDLQDTNIPQSATQETQEKREFPEVDASKLIDDLEANALNASEKYKNKDFGVVGAVSVIDSSGEYISLKPTNDEFSVTLITCDLNSDEQRQIVKQLSVGDKIIVQGKITDVGEVIGYSLDVYNIETIQ